MNVVIVLYNSCSVLNRCLEALERAAQFSGLNVNVALVDNQFQTQWPNLKSINSSFFKSKNLKLYPVYSPRNDGFGDGCRQGIEFLGAESFLLLNPDAFVSVNFFNVLLSDINHIGCKNYLIGFDLRSSIDGSRTRNGGIMPESFAKSQSVFLPGYRAELGVNCKVWPLAACLYVSTSIHPSKLFSDEFFLTMEEPVLVKRLSSGILFFSSALAVHDGGHSYSSSVAELTYHRDSLEIYSKLFKFNFLSSFKIYISLLKLNFLIKLKGFL